MSHQASPKTIGLFVTVAVVLLVAMVLFFGSSSLLTKSERFILFFDQSVNGLASGSPVKFRGVPVGSVERILIRAEGQRESSTAIPVIIKLDRSRLEQDLGVSEEAFSPENIHQSIARGLVAELNLESFITGQLFVEFSFETEGMKERRPHLEAVNGVIEIPTLGSSLDEITSDVARLISDLGAIDLPRLNKNVNEVLENLSSMLEGVDSEGMSESFITAAGQIEALAGSEDFKDSIAALKTAMVSINDTVKTYNLDNGPLASTITTWTKSFQDTLTGLDGLVTDTSDLMSSESDFRYKIENTLREMSRMAQSIRLLADYLERNPNALLTGRPEDEE
ncbi:MAG: MlaD family protein [Opitutaceae bacterium]